MESKKTNEVLFDINEAIRYLPNRAREANKGSFGKALVIAGSEQYAGAGHLALESALRGGAGYVGYLNEDKMCDLALMKYPEAIYHRTPISDVDSALSVASAYSSVLIGPGLGCNERTARLTESLITSDGGTLIVDADGLNSIARYSGVNVFTSHRRDIVVTPHPLEFSRLVGIGVDDINADRSGYARAFAREYGVTLLLKGSGTVVTDGERVYVNTSGNTALAKGGTGDVLSGLIASLSAFMQDKTLSAILSAFIHGLAAERESGVLSSFGVLPSELPRRIAEVICDIEKAQKM